MTIWNWETWPGIFYNVKHALILSDRSSTSRHLSKTNESMCLRKILYGLIRSSFICHGQYLETTQKSINRRIDRIHCCIFIQLNITRQ